MKWVPIIAVVPAECVAQLEAVAQERAAAIEDNDAVRTLFVLNGWTPEQLVAGGMIRAGLAALTDARPCVPETPQ